MCLFAILQKKLCTIRLTGLVLCLLFVFFSNPVVATGLVSINPFAGFSGVCPDPVNLTLPNAFSPNGDGVNDQFCIQGWNDCIQSFRIMIFNRWGEKVFETTDINKGWDGTYKGQLMNTDVFVYRLEGKTHDGKGFSLKGNITLVR